MYYVRKFTVRREHRHEDDGTWNALMAAVQGGCNESRMDTDNKALPRKRHGVIRVGRISLYREIYTIFPRYLTVPGEYKKNLREPRKEDPPDPGGTQG